MWAWLYLALLGIAFGLTWSFAVRETAIVFTSMTAGLFWALLSLTPELTVVSGGETIVVTVGPVSWLLAAMALLSFTALVGSILGVYPERHPDRQQFSEVR